MATDKIIPRLQRVYVEKWCAEGCPFSCTDECEERIYCTAFPAEDDELDENGSMKGDGSGILRLRACLSTPPARVLTPEMVEAVKDAAGFLAESDDKYNNSGPFWGEELRVAFGIEEVTNLKKQISKLEKMTFEESMEGGNHEDL